MSASTSASASSWPPAPYGEVNVPSRTNDPSHHHPDMSSYLATFRNDLRSSWGARRRPRPTTAEDESLEDDSDEAGYQGDAEERSKMRQQQARPPSLTMSVWRGGSGDPGEWKVRLAALGATLAINMLLPFVNGVMLGFGEITAREIVGYYLGWGPAADGRKRWWEPASRSSSSTEARRAADPTDGDRSSEYAGRSGQGVRTASGVGLR